MNIVITIFITALITLIAVYLIMKPSIEKKVSLKEKQLKENYEKAYYKKEDQLKGYYEGLLEKEELKYKKSIKLERERYDEKLAEMNEAYNKDIQLLKMHYRSKLYK